MLATFQHLIPYFDTSTSCVAFQNQGLVQRAMEESGRILKSSPKDVTQRKNKSVSTWPLCYRQFEEGYKWDYVIVYVTSITFIHFTDTWHKFKGGMLISHSTYNSSVSVEMN